MRDRTVKRERCLRLEVLEERLPPSSLSGSGSAEAGGKNRDNPLRSAEVMPQAAVLHAHTPSQGQAARALRLVVPPRANDSYPNGPGRTLPFGQTYGKWSADWWRWALSVPAAEHPLLDAGDSSVGQSGRVWFLGGSFLSSTVTRESTIPAGKALFFPLANTVFTERTDLFDESESRKEAKASLDTTTGLRAEIDGRSVKNLQTYRVQSPVFQTTVAPDTILDAFDQYPAGTSLTNVGDGYYVFVRPLPVGDHTLHFSATFANDPDDPTDDLVLDVTYEITVVPRRRR